jgi:hypothetical protein
MLERIKGYKKRSRDARKRSRDTKKRSRDARKRSRDARKRIKGCWKRRRAEKIKGRKDQGPSKEWHLPFRGGMIGPCHVILEERLW